MCVVTNPCSGFMPDSLYIEDSCPHERKKKKKNRVEVRMVGRDTLQGHTAEALIAGYVRKKRWWA